MYLWLSQARSCTGRSRASVTDRISYYESSKMCVKFTPGIAKQTGNSTVHVKIWQATCNPFTAIIFM